MNIKPNILTIVIFIFRNLLCKIRIIYMIQTFSM